MEQDTEYAWPGGYVLKWPQEDVEAKMRSVGLTPEIMNLVDEIFTTHFRNPQQGSRQDFYFRTNTETGDIQVRIDDPQLAARLGLPNLTEWS